MLPIWDLVDGVRRIDLVSVWALVNFWAVFFSPVRVSIKCSKVAGSLSGVSGETPELGLLSPLPSPSARKT